ncbi:MAG TPA: NnrU family protein [Hyphomicrobium sp.]|nr:NnrU family protein [Hyphomicrobium sp.]
MMLMIVGLVIFLGIHLLPTSPEIRNGLANRLGPGMYRAIFSLISLGGFVVIVLGYHKMQLHPGKNPVLWDPPAFMRHITLALMLPSMILLVAAYVPSRIRTAVKHPMLMAVKLWALAHLLANGDLASILLFGSFLGYAAYDLVSVKARGALGPLGTKEPASILNDVAVVVVGSAFYFAMLYRLHEWLIGVAPLPALSA